MHRVARPAEAIGQCLQQSPHCARSRSEKPSSEVDEEIRFSLAGEPLFLSPDDKTILKLRLVLLADTSISVVTVAQTAEFGSKPIAGQIMQVQVISESSTYALLALALAAKFALTHFAFRPAKRAGNLFVQSFEIQIDFIAELSNLQLHLLLSNRAPSIKKRWFNQPQSRLKR